MTHAPRAALAAALALAAGLARAAGPAGPMDGPWPHTLSQGGVTFLLYQPELQRWDGELLRARAVVAAQEGERTSYGLLELEARAVADRDAGVAHVAGYRVVQARFPAAGPRSRGWGPALAPALAAPFDAPLEKLEQDLAIARAARPKPRAARNDPPAVAVRDHPALLVLVDGDPQWRRIEGTALERVVNARPLLVRAGPGGPVYLHLLDGWLEAPALEGPYAVAKAPPPALAQAYAWGAQEPDVDLLQARAEPGAPPREAGAGEKVAAPTLAAGAPEIVIATRPTALVVTEGPPQLEAVGDTGLLYWKNTSADVLVDSASGALYLLQAGRWFTAAAPAGPWRWVDGRALPPAFARIPPGHPKESVLASVPGTPQAREALVANAVPQTATVKRAEARFEPRFDGAPALAPIEGTRLQYVRNSATPVIAVDPAHWYAVANGVWFEAPTASGPWSVAASVPAALYTIPPSSPVHEVTYVRVYGATPEVVWVGYTPGYLGTYAADGVVVYGTGYWYRPWVGAAWYGWPWTYGYGVRVGWSSWYGWGVSCWYPWRPAGFWWGFGVGPYWGPMALYRPVFWGYARPAYWGYYHGVAPAPPRAAAGAYGQWHGAVAAAPHPAPALAAAPRPAPPAAALGRPGPMAPHPAALNRGAGGSRALAAPAHAAPPGRGAHPGRRGGPKRR